MPDFSHRSMETEIMDDLGATGPDLVQALRELDGINYLLGGNYVTLNALAQLLDSHSTGDSLHIADVGCGSGDMLRRIRRLLETRDIDGVLTGFDANPNVIRFAETRTPAKCKINYEPINIFSDQFKGRNFDIVTGTLFFHHFGDDQLVSLFADLRRHVRLGIIINDIHRHWFAYYSIKWLTRILSKSHMVRNDGPLSVLRAFKKRELRTILERAGIQHYRIKWCWAFRWQVIVNLTKPVI